MTFVFDLASELEKKQTAIKVKSLISGNGWGEININSLNGSPVFLTSPIQDLKIRFQQRTNHYFRLIHQLENYFVLKFLLIYQQTYKKQN